jgi:hypothetical protein
MESSDKNSLGILTPSFFAIDNIIIK